MRAALALAALLGPIGNAQAPNPQGIKVDLEKMMSFERNMTEEQLQSFAKRIFIDKEPFLSSQEAVTYPNTLGHYLTKVEYRGMKGNPAIGYYGLNGFTWPSDQAEVQFMGIRATVPETRGIRGAAWEKAMQLVARHMNLKVVPKAAIRIEGACVDATLAPTEESPIPGVTLELKIHGATGTMVYRYSLGKPTIGDAIGASLEWCLTVARNMGKEGPLPDFAKKEGAHGPAKR